MMNEIPISSKGPKEGTASTPVTHIYKNDDGSHQLSQGQMYCVRILRRSWKD